MPAQPGPRPDQLAQRSATPGDVLAAGTLTAPDPLAVPSYQTPTGAVRPFWEDQFIGVESQEADGLIGDHGWFTDMSGGGGATSRGNGIAGHPGVVVIEHGAVSGDWTNIHRGLEWKLSQDGSVGTIEFEWLIRFRQSIDAGDIQGAWLGLSGLSGHATGQPSDGIFVEFNPTADSHFRLLAVNASTPTLVNGITVVVINTWYRVGWVYTDVGGPAGSLQLKVNGVNEGAPITTNLPSVATALEMFAKFDSANLVVDEPRLDIDRLRIYHVQNEED